MPMSLPGNLHNNDTIREMFYIVFTQYTYSLVLFTLYGIPSLLMTIKVVLTILNPAYKNYFRTPFFVLFTHDCVMNFLFFFFDFFVFRLPISGLITAWMTSLPLGVYLCVFYALNYQLNYMSIYSALFMSISRTVLIYYPISGGMVVRQLLPVFFLTIYFLPILTTWFIYPATCFVSIGDFPGFGATIDYVKRFPKWRNSACLAIVASICSFLYLLSSVATLCRMRSLSKTQGKRADNIGRAERSMTIVTLSVFFCILTLAATNAYFLYVSDVNVALTLRPFQMDLLIFTPIWVLYLTHPAFKRNTQQGTLTMISITR